MAYAASRTPTNDADPVLLSLSVTSITHVDDVKQEIKLSVVEQRVWEDVRLKFSKTEALCIVGSGTGTSTWMAMDYFDYEVCTSI